MISSKNPIFNNFDKIFIQFIIKIVADNSTFIPFDKIKISQLITPTDIQQINRLNNKCLLITPPRTRFQLTSSKNIPIDSLVIISTYDSKIFHNNNPIKIDKN